MKLTNQKILEIFEALNQVFNDNTKYIPMKIGFAIQKNSIKLLNLVKEIEDARIQIGKEYGVKQINQETNQEYYSIPEDKLEKTQQELNDLLSLEQEVDIQTVKLNDIEELEFTFAQINALMFMIEE